MESTSGALNGKLLSSHTSVAVSAVALEFAGLGLVSPVLPKHSVFNVSMKLIVQYLSILLDMSASEELGNQQPSKRQMSFCLGFFPQQSDVAISLRWQDKNI